MFYSLYFLMIFIHMDFYEKLSGIQIFEHRVGMEIFGPEKEEMSGELRTFVIKNLIIFTLHKRHQLDQIEYDGIEGHAARIGGRYFFSPVNIFTKGSLPRLILDVSSLRLPRCVNYYVFRYVGPFDSSRGTRMWRGMPGEKRRSSYRMA